MMVKFGRNPHAPKGALQYSDIRKGLELVVIRGGAFYHERLTVVSGPKEEHPEQPTTGYKLDKVDLPPVKHYLIATSGGAAAATEISSVGDRASNTPTKHSLDGLGLCPDDDGRWSTVYCVPAKDYRPDDHE